MASEEEISDHREISGGRHKILRQKKFSLGCYLIHDKYRGRAPDSLADRWGGDHSHSNSTTSKSAPLRFKIQFVRNMNKKWEKILSILGNPVNFVYVRHENNSFQISLF